MGPIGSNILNPKRLKIPKKSKKYTKSQKILDTKTYPKTQTMIQKY